MENITNLNIDLLLPNPNQPRKSFNAETINELSNSIKQYGILNPLLVIKKDDKYEIIAGERRYRAAKIVGLKEVPVIIKNIDDEKAKEIALIENLQRENLNAVEEAKTYQDIIKTLNITEKELGEKIGKSQSAIANKIRLLNLPKEVLDAIVNKKISERHARTLLSVTDTEKRNNLLNEIITKKLTVKELERKLKEEKESDNMNNGNFFPNFNTPVGESNGISLNMMNQQNMGISTEPVTPVEETVMPTATPVVEQGLPVIDINPVSPAAVEPATPVEAPASTPQFDIPLFNQNVAMPQPAQTEAINPFANIEPIVAVTPEVPVETPINTNIQPEVIKGDPAVVEPAAPVEVIVPPVEEPLFTTPVSTTPVEEITSTIIEPTPEPVAPLPVEPATPVEVTIPTLETSTSAVEPLFTAPVSTTPVEEIAPTIIEPNPEPVTQITEVPLVEENKLQKVENYLKEQGISYKLYSNDTNSCIIIEM